MRIEDTTPEAGDEAPGFGVFSPGVFSPGVFSPGVFSPRATAASVTAASSAQWVELTQLARDALAAAAADPRDNRAPRVVLADARAQFIEQAAVANRAVHQAQAEAAAATDRFIMFTAAASVVEEDVRPPTPVVDDRASGSSGSSVPGPRWSKAQVLAVEQTTEIAAAFTISGQDADAWIYDSHHLIHDLPETFATLSRGEISLRSAQNITGEAMSLPAEARESFQKAMLPVAVVRTPQTVLRKARLLREKTHPETIVKRHKRALTDRRCWVDNERDGMANFTMYLDAAKAHQIHDHLTALGEEIHHAAVESNKHAAIMTMASLDGAADAAAGNGTSAFGPAADLPAGKIPTPWGNGGMWDDPTPPVVDPSQWVPDGVRPDPDLDYRTQAQTIVDVATDFLLGAAVERDGDAGAGAGAGKQSRRVNVSITVPVMTLLGLDDKPPTLDGYGPIPLESALDLMGSASSFTRILTHPETGVIMSVGREQYAVPADLKRWLQMRDGTCRFVGCNRAAIRCDIDHTEAWAEGGCTDADNLAHLCRKHHRMKHETGWEVTNLGDGTLTWRSPAGRMYSTEPAVTIDSRTHLSSPFDRPRRPSQPPDHPQGRQPDAPPQDHPPGSPPDHVPGNAPGAMPAKEPNADDFDIGGPE